MAVTRLADKVVLCVNTRHGRRCGRFPKETATMRGERQDYG
jgi:hypothetical protein